MDKKKRIEADICNRHSLIVKAAKSYCDKALASLETAPADPYAKQSLFRLDNDSHGKSSIKNQNPFENTDEFVIRCGPHRAFDACLNQPFFVVLEEAQTPNDQRKVSLYRRQKRNAIDTYAPPVKRFQPSDVCFYTLGGHEVLLVADELNDAIHVVNVQDGRLSFARYLAPGCPLLVQPTALNTDTRGRLGITDTLTSNWVKTISRPVLRFHTEFEETLKNIRDYMASAAKMEMAVSAPEVTVMEQFRCREDPDTDVYHVCPMTDEECTVTCGAHRAFDVDASEQLFVVLEEAQAPDLQRSVRLYRRPQPHAIDTYSPPVAPFQPSDVCFYTLGGHEVLLVADELNDVIHVVNVQDGRLSFARYLAPGCPLLVQPTALNTDTRGRLWVAWGGEIQLPSGGVSAFKNNFYIKPEDLDKARNSTFCSKHPKKELEVYCVRCDVLICVTCLISSHKQHEAEDMSEAKDRLKAQLRKDKSRLDDSVMTVKTNAAEARRQEEKELKDKKSAVKDAILNRHATLQTALDKFRDDALTSLDKITYEIEAQLATNSDSQLENLEELTKLQQQVQQAVDSGAGCELVTVAREMRCGRGSEEAVQKLTTKQMTTVCRPVLRFSATHDVTLERMRDYMGSAAKMEMAVSAPEVTVIEQFRCREDPDTDVCHVCPMTDGSVEQLFVVLEEAQAPDLQRTVRLYRRPQPDAIATYSPPVAPFQPSDVCFYTLDGHEVLLVADELNDAIHVVNVQDGRLSFERYMAPGCPLLVQPTALNTDTRGRLWVALRMALRGTKRKDKTLDPHRIPLDQLPDAFSDVFSNKIEHIWSELDKPTLKIMRDYMGSAAKMEMAVSAPEVTVIEQFRCREDPDTDVYHVCPTTDEIKTYISFAKRIEPRLTRFFQLENNLTGQATVHSVTIVVEDPLETEALEASIVTCAAHRAFDVDASEQLFVVLEEVQAPDLQRTVRLYRRPQPDAIATYSPPVAPFQPSDVCFYTLGGHEVLLVADELNDAIHVVNVQDGRLNFARYLAPGCPLLVQPTALNTDTRGRLWVAWRGDIQLPSGGVSAFRSNFYIKPEDLDKARNSTFCSKHPKKELEVYCVRCDVLICVTCLVNSHKQHEAEDISEATDWLKAQLRKDKSRLDDSVMTVKTNAAEARRQEEKELKDKKSAVKDAILNRHATLQTALDKFRDDALTSLDKITDEIETQLATNSDCQQENLEELTKLQQRVQQAVDSGAGCELVTVAREMRCGRGSEEAVQKLTTKQMTTVCRPVLRFSATLDATLERMRDYMGSAAKMEMAVSAPEVTVMEQFRCREDPDTDVCHVCPLTDGKVSVSEQLFVVLEEAQAPDLQRTVRLYRRPQPDAIATYSPPVAPFQPSDVCFYTLDGHEVLLVADELNDAIHVVNVQDGCLSFARYLAPGCPLLVQPTALNADTRCRLWVACRGGRIITCTPIS
nr:hypothetical protein BaRGS_011302 [Batillaria attramentaria]